MLIVIAFAVQCCLWMQLDRLMYETWQATKASYPLMVACQIHECVLFWLSDTSSTLPEEPSYLGGREEVWEWLGIGFQEAIKWCDLKKTFLPQPPNKTGANSKSSLGPFKKISWWYTNKIFALQAAYPGSISSIPYGSLESVRCNPSAGVTSEYHRV